MRAGILLALVLHTALLSAAQAAPVLSATRSLSLRECVDLALSRNLDLQIVHLTADIAAYDLRGAYGVYSPLFTFGAQHNYLDQPGNFDPKKASPDLPYQLDQDTLNAGLTGQLPIGLSYDFNTYVTDERALTDFSSIPNNNFPGGIRDTNNTYADAQLALRQHLLKDFWIDASREQILIRRQDLKISQQAFRFQLMKTLLAVELSYDDLIAARENVRVQEKALELRQQLVAETKRRVEVGDLPPLDVDQAQTQLENTLTALATARELLLSQQNFLIALLTDDFRAWADIDLLPADSLMAMPPAVNRSDSFFNALKNRPDLIEARIAIEKSNVAIRFRKNQLFPNVDLVGGYGGIGIDPQASTAINNTYSFLNPNYYYGVVLSVPLDNVTERNSYRASKASKQIAELQLKKAEQDVLVQIADLVNRVQSRFSQIGSTHQARVYAEAALAAEQKKLQNGLSTAFVVLQLQETLTAARTAEFQAMADYNKILAQLAFAEGTILEKHHLNIEIK
jgi:outer membrane protein TolC